MQKRFFKSEKEIVQNMTSSQKFSIILRRPYRMNTPLSAIGLARNWNADKPTPRDPILDLTVPTMVMFAGVCGRPEDNLWAFRSLSGNVRRQLFMRSKSSAHAPSMWQILFFCFSRVEEGFLLLTGHFCHNLAILTNFFYVLLESNGSATSGLSLKKFWWSGA